MRFASSAPPTLFLSLSRSSAGRGRQTTTQKNNATIEQELIQLVEPETSGDPQSRCQYTRSSWRSLAKRLERGSATTIGRLLKSLGYSLKTSVKRLIGKSHPSSKRLAVSLDWANQSVIHSYWSTRYQCGCQTV
jgi:hypothetical protein